VNTVKILVTLLMLAAFWAVPAEAARKRSSITPAFDAVTVQGSICAVPCHVYLNAKATTATGVARPFEDLDYEWMSGDQKGEWPINTFRFEEPGTYPITLKVIRRDTGEIAFLTKYISAAASTAVTRVALERGRSYPPSVLPSVSPLVVEAVGTGERPVITGDVNLRSGWTIDGVNINGGVNNTCGNKGVSLSNSIVRKPGSEQLWTSPYGSCGVMNDLAVLWNVELRGDQGRVLYVRNDRFVVRHSVLDGGKPMFKGGINCLTGECPNGYVVRTVGFREGAIIDSAIYGPAPKDNPIQLRSWGQSSPPARDNRWIVIANNDMEAFWPRETFVRICDNETCGNVAQANVDVRDLLIARNIMTIEVGGQLGLALMSRYQAGWSTYQDNTIDISQAVLPTFQLVFLREDPITPNKPKSTPGEYSKGNMQVRRNTVVGTRGRTVDWLMPLPTSTGNVVTDNVAAP
jgi:hypothetical protein